MILLRHPVVLCVLASLLVPGIAPASAAAGTEHEAAPTLELHQGCDLASDSLLAARGATGVGDALKGLKAGSSSRVKLVDSADELEGLFGKLSAGGKPLEGTTYPGKLVQLPDGTKVGIRPGSTSGGAHDRHPSTRGQRMEGARGWAMSSVGAMLDELVRRGADDWVGAWEVADIARAIAPDATDAEVLDLSLHVIQEALVRNLVDIGDVVGTGSHPVYRYESCSFRPWALPIEAAMDRVKREWLALGRSPTLGEVCWLGLSETGRMQVRQSEHRKGKGGDA